jgi:hypothetical protein
MIINNSSGKSNILDGPININDTVVKKEARIIITGSYTHSGMKERNAPVSVYDMEVIEKHKLDNAPCRSYYFNFYAKISN